MGLIGTGAGVCDSFGSTALQFPECLISFRIISF